MIKYTIPLFFIMYLFMIGLKPFISITEFMMGASPEFEPVRKEIFPFFAWTLFSRTPEWTKHEAGLVVHSIDGIEIADGLYVVPSDSINDQKALIGVIGVCRSSSHASSCGEIVKRVVYPIARRLANGNDIEFSIVDLSIDLRDVQRDIESIAAGQSKHSDYYEIEAVLSRWSTERGLVWAQSP